MDLAFWEKKINMAVDFDPSNPRHWIDEYGSAFFLAGIECVIATGLLHLLKDPVLAAGSLVLLNFGVVVLQLVRNKQVLQ